MKKVWAAANKWSKHRVLSHSKDLQELLPDTAELSITSLGDFLAKYSNVYLKPMIGSGGYGIIKISKVGNGYEIQSNSSKRLAKSFDVLLRYIKGLLNKCKYVVQRGIDLLRIENRPIDFRILLLRPQNKWECMGIMGKLGRAHKIVTNYCQGSQAVPIPILQKYDLYTEEELEELEQVLSEIGKTIGATIQRRYPYVREIGLDIAIDTNKQIWILEANTRPNFKLFRHHPDKTLYSKINKVITSIRYRTRS